MDASKFSLSEATELLKPHFNDLPFRRLGEYSEQKYTIDTRTYHFRIYPRHMTAPIDVTLESMVFRVFVQYREVVIGKKIVGEELFLERPCGDIDSSVWLCRTTEYAPATTRATTLFYSDESEMGRVGSVLGVSGWIMMVDGFHASCWGALEEWARQSISRREKANSRLRTLASKLETHKTETEKLEKLY